MDSDGSDSEDLDDINGDEVCITIIVLHLLNVLQREI